MPNFVKQADGSYADTELITVGNIAGNVVDDTQSITIPASGEPPEPPEFEIPWTMIALGGAAVVAVIVAVFVIRR